MTSGDAEPTGLRERRRASVKREIALCAAELFEKQGLANTTAEQIAAAAGISLRTFYRHCPIKEEALSVLLAEGLEEFLAEFGRRPSGERLAVAAGAATLHAWKDVHNDARRIVQIMLAEPALEVRWVAGVRRAQALLVPLVAQRLGDDPNSLRARVAAGLILNMSSTALEYWVTHDQGESLAEVVAIACGLLETSV